MKPGHRKILAKVTICALLMTTTVTATAQSSTPIGGVTKADAVWIGVAVAAIGAGVGVGVYYAFHHGHSLNGCVVSSAGGLELRNRGDQQTYALVGEIGGITAGDRVRVSGKKEQKNSGGPQQFLVEKLSRDYGVCKVETATR